MSQHLKELAHLAHINEDLALQYESEMMLDPLMEKDRNISASYEHAKWESDLRSPPEPDKISVEEMKSLEEKIDF